MQNPTPKYKRVLLKLSGEALMGPDQFGINRTTLSGIVEEIKSMLELGVELGVVAAAISSAAWRSAQPAWTGPRATTWVCSPPS